MSRQNFILLISFILVLTISVFLYIYTQNNKSVPEPTLTPEEMVREAQRQELSQFVQNPEDVKSKEEMKKELDAFKPLPPEKSLSKEEMRKELESVSPNP